VKGFNTRAIHGQGGNRDLFGSIRRPIYESVSFEFETAAEMEEAFKGRSPHHAYSRITNPSVAELEEKITALSGALGCIAVSSGMAAISNLAMALCEQGDNVVLSNALFGNTLSLFGETLKHWGLETRVVDFNEIESVKAAVDDKTRLLFVESISNPQMGVVDFDEVALLAQNMKVPLVVDNTVTTFYLFDARTHGADIELISSTKYISGGATTVGGLVIDHGSYDWKLNPKLRKDATKYGPWALLRRLRMEVYRNFGACLSPHNAYLQVLGLETLTMRIDRSCENTLALAEYLHTRSEVQRVNYPGLKGSEAYKNAKKYLLRGFGGILTFNLRDKEQCYRFMDTLKLIKRATNINDNKTLIIHPASTIFAEYGPAQKKEMGVGENTLRLSVGIEDLSDLKEDIDKALEMIN